MSVEALYLHIPFCASKCAYCDFDSQACPSGDASLKRCEGALASALEVLGSAGALSGVRTVYIGGGTPSLLGSGLPRIVHAVRDWCAPVELTCEANPDSFAMDLARELAEAGATRVSLGVQSFDDGELSALSRIHTSAAAKRAVEAAHSAGLSTSIDLMCGIPLQTEASWESTLACACELPIDHVSVYPLTVEEGTPLAARCEEEPSLLPDEDFQASCMVLARAVLGRAGFAPYEVASYARPGHECRHNIAYWTGVPYLGLGRSAASMLDRATYGSVRGLLGLPEASPQASRMRFVQTGDTIGAGGSYDLEELTEREALAEDLMLGMRMTAGVAPDLLRRARRLIGEERVDAALRVACDEGLAQWVGGSGGRLVPTERGWLMGNELYGLMWGLADGPRSE